jgi:ubiquinone biosynthesis protein Coq4
MLGIHNSVGIIICLIVAAVGTVLVTVALQAVARIPLIMTSVSWNWVMF